MAISHLYRVNGGQVRSATVDDPAVVWAGTLNDPIVGPYFASVTDADLSGYTEGSQAIYDAGAVRDATAPEIANFQVAEDFDNNLIAREYAKRYIDADVRWRKVLKAVVAVTVDELNVLRALHSLPDRTLAQAKTAIENKIDAGGEVD